MKNSKFKRVFSICLASVLIASSSGTALAANADIVIMDEPFKGLDEDTRARAAGVIQEALRGRTLLLVTHDPDEAAVFGGRILDFNAL